MSDTKYDREVVPTDDLDRFILVWNTSGDIREVISRMGGKDTEDQRSYYVAKASRMRTDGFYMKSMRGRRDKRFMSAYSHWVRGMIKEGVTDGRSLRTESFDSDRNKRHYLDYADYRMGGGERGFDEWMRETGRASEASISDEELEELRDTQEGV